MWNQGAPHFSCLCASFPEVFERSMYTDNCCEHERVVSADTGCLSALESLSGSQYLLFVPVTGTFTATRQPPSNARRTSHTGSGSWPQQVGRRASSTTLEIVHIRVSLLRSCSSTLVSKHIDGICPPDSSRPWAQFQCSGSQPAGFEIQKGLISPF